MKKLIEVKVTYTDETDEMLLMTAEDYAAAEMEAEAWVDYRKTVKDITAIGESKHQRRGRAGGSHG